MGLHAFAANAAPTGLFFYQFYIQLLFLVMCVNFSFLLDYIIVPIVVSFLSLKLVS